MKKKFEMSVTANATVTFHKDILAETPEEARQIFATLLKQAALLSEALAPEYNVLEWPVLTHDYELTDIEAYEHEKEKE